jgi:osmotically inducible protein OsmC
MATFSRHAVVDWNGDVMHGTGTVTAGTAAFTVPVTFPRIAGETPGNTTPEEMLAASHAICYAIGLRSVIAQRGGIARRVRVTATITAEKGPQGIRIQSSHLNGVVEGLEGIERMTLQEMAQAAEDGCTISIAIRGSVAISFDVAAI